MVEVSNSGQFVATAFVAHGRYPTAAPNPTLTAGTHRLTCEDNEGFTGTDINFTIAEPTVTVTPDIAGPRDYVTVTGANWPVDNPENPLEVSVSVEIDDVARSWTTVAKSTPTTRAASPRSTVCTATSAIPSNNQVKASYGDVVKVGSFSVPASTIEVTPAKASLVTSSACPPATCRCTTRSSTSKSAAPATTTPASTPTVTATSPSTTC